MSCRFKQVNPREISKDLKHETKSNNNLNKQVSKTKSSTPNFRNIQFNRKRRASVLSNSNDSCNVRHENMSRVQT